MGAIASRLIFLGLAACVATTAKADWLSGVLHHPLEMSICSNLPVSPQVTTEPYAFPAAVTDRPPVASPRFSLPASDPSPVVLTLALLGAGVLLLKRVVPRLGRSPIGKLLTGLSLSLVVVALGVLAAARGLPWLERSVRDAADLHAQIAAAPAVERAYALLVPWVWRENPVRDLTATLEAFGMLRALARRDIAEAVGYAERAASPNLGWLQEPIFLLAAKHAHARRQYSEALVHAERAERLSGSTLAREAVRTIRANQAVRAALDGEFDAAMRHLEQIDSGADELLVDAWTSVIRLHVGGVLASSPPRHFERASEAVHVHLRRFSALTGRPIPDPQHCLYAVLLQETGLQALAEGRGDEAVEALSAATVLVPGFEDARLLLIEALLTKGRAEIEQGEFAAAVDVLERALAYDAERADTRCTLAIARAEHAVDLAMLGRFDDAHGHAAGAAALCAFEGIETPLALIDLQQGQSFLRRGRWEDARGHLARAVSRDAGPASATARTLLNDIPRARVRQSRLAEAGKWFDQVPEVTGSHCLVLEASADCASIMLFRDEKMIGTAAPDFREVYFEDVGGREVVLKDSLGAGRIDTVQVSDGGRHRVLTEIDGDLRLDGELVLDDSGRVLSEKRHSGRVLMRFASGAIAKRTDFWSAPDPYIVVSINGRYLCHTETAAQSAFAEWLTACVADYRKDDRIALSIWDEDALEEDDYIDGFVMHELPRTGTLHGDHAAIELQVSPTRIPPGAYRIERAELVNTFEHARFEADDPVGRIAERARSVQQTGDRMAAVASWTAPELLVLSLLRQQRLAVQLLASIVGSEVLHDQLAEQ